MGAAAIFRKSDSELVDFKSEREREKRKKGKRERERGKRKKVKRERKRQRKKVKRENRGTERKRQTKNDVNDYETFLSSKFFRFTADFD